MSLRQKNALVDNFILFSNILATLRVRMPLFLNTLTNELQAHFV